MKGFEKELYGYANGAERMSGFDSYDSAEGDMDYFDGDEMSYFDNDEMSYAGGNQGSAPVSDPYVLQYSNSTTNDVTAYIFGFNLYNGVSNYGNPAAVTITNLQNSTVGYGGLINQSNNKPFKIGKWRFQSSTASQLQQTLVINHVDANGKTYTTPVNLSIMLDAYQQQSTVLDVTKPVTIDGNTYISFTLKASATLTISMFPVNVISSKAVLNGGKSLNTARAPRLSAKNVSPVIIQTSSDVKGINK